MNKGGITQFVIKAIFVIAIIGIIIMSGGIAMLYQPSVQRYITQKALVALSQESEFDITAKDISLTFPLKLVIEDFVITKEDKTIAQGEKIAASIYPPALFYGKIEINYIMLENVAFSTGSTIENTTVEGKIGYLRGVIRSIDLARQRADIRQFSLQESNIAITTKKDNKEEENKEPLDWVFSLHKAHIKNTGFSMHMPDDTMHIAVHAGEMNINSGIAGIKENIFSIEEVAFKGIEAKYDSGNRNRDEAPLEHIEIENMVLKSNDISYSREGMNFHIEHLAVKQKNGIELAGNGFSVRTDSTRINISQLNLQSAKGSFIACDANIPFDLIHGKKSSKIYALLSAHINKSDLKDFLTAEQQKQIASLPDSMLNARIAIDGTIAKAYIDTAYISIPGIADVWAKGDIKEIGNKKKRNARFTAKANIMDIAALRGEAKRNDTLSLQNIIINGKGEMSGSLCLADIDITGDGSAALAGTYNTEHSIYDARISTNALSLATFLPDIPLKSLTMQATLSGKGTNIFDKETYYHATLLVDSIMYDTYNMNGILITAIQANSKSQISLHTDNKDSRITLYANSDIKEEYISNATTIDIAHLALDKLGISDKPASTGMEVEIAAYSDMQERHGLKLNAKELFINTSHRNFKPKPVDFDFATAPDSSHIDLKNGDLELHGKLESGYTHLFAQLGKMNELFQKARTNEKSIYYATDFEELMPAFGIEFKCGKENVLHNFMAWNGINFTAMDFSCNIDTLKEIHANGAIYDFETGDTKLDTLRMFARQSGDSIRYFAGIRSSATNAEDIKQNFSAALYGILDKDSLDTNISFSGNERKNRTTLGIKTLLKPQGLDISVKPTMQVFGEKVDINRDNYIRIGKNSSISANVKATDKRGSGLHFYTIEDSTAQHDISLEIFNIDLKRATSMIPYAPDIAGTLYSDLHYRNDSHGMIFSGDVRGDSLTYEGTYIGNELIESVYLPRKDKSHYLALILQHNDNEVLNINGDYSPGNEIDGEATLTHLPLQVLNAFIKGSDIGVDGDIDGTLALKGPLASAVANGYIMFDSVRIDAPLLGSELKMHNDVLSIKDNRIIFDNLNIYAKGNTPFKVNGDIDIANLTNPEFNLKMQAREYEIINAPRQKGSIVYGNLVLNINSFITGPLQNLNINGNATVLGKSNITYVMTESELAANNELDGLVEFVNFKDSTNTHATENIHDFGNIKMSMGVDIEDGAWINADFDEARNSYITLQGGGRLNMGYSSEEGITLTGRYTLNNGEMKYNLPIIPLKTFSISPGSYVNWSGDIMNPTLNITALERVTAPVAIDGGNSQAVAFDVGLKLTNSLDNMGLAFTMQAPENAAVQDELNRLDAETLNKYAVTMLITGAYVGNSGGLTVSNALTSFLDAKINDLAGDAMKSVSINVGITDVENKETGDSYMNYSFSFAKRFWNDRLTVVIGGEVNSGNMPEEEQSFINNVSLEWRITPNGNRYVRLFYDKNYESILEGEITETGVGYVYKRKLNNLNELLMFKRKEKNSPTPQTEKKE